MLQKLDQINQLDQPKQNKTQQLAGSNLNNRTIDFFFFDYADGLYPSSLNTSTPSKRKNVPKLRVWRCMIHPKGSTWMIGHISCHPIHCSIRLLITCDAEKEMHNLARLDMSINNGWFSTCRPYLVIQAITTVESPSKRRWLALKINVAYRILTSSSQLDP